MSRLSAGKGKIAFEGKKRLSKNAAVLIKQELKQELNLLKLNQKEAFTLTHCTNLIQHRNDEDRVQELVDLFRIADINENSGILQFYWWYKDNPISKTDCAVYLIFDQVGADLGLNQCNPTRFSGICSSLIERFEIWKGEAGNSIEDLLIDYFTSVLPKAVKFNSVFATSPKSLLDSFGWNLWEEHIRDQYGGKLLYLEASKEQLDKSKVETKKLKEIQSLKDKALRCSDIEGYDKIGKLLSTQTIGETHEKLLGNGNPC